MNLIYIPCKIKTLIQAPLAELSYQICCSLFFTFVLLFNLLLLVVVLITTVMNFDDAIMLKVGQDCSVHVFNMEETLKQLMMTFLGPMDVFVMQFV